MCQKLDHAKDFTVASNLLKEEERLKLLEDKLVKFLNQNSNNNEINLGNDNENCIASDNETNKEYLNMKENAIHFINSYIAKKFDDDIFIGLIINYKGEFWHVEYKDGDKEDFDVIELKEGIQLYNFVKKIYVCMYLFRQ